MKCETHPVPRNYQAPDCKGAHSLGEEFICSKIDRTIGELEAISHVMTFG